MDEMGGQEHWVVLQNLSVGYLRTEVTSLMGPQTSV